MVGSTIPCTRDVWRHAAFLAVLIGLMGCTQPDAPPDAQTYRVSPVRVPFPQSNGPTLQLNALVFAPNRPGRFPLAVVSHGTAPSFHAGIAASISAPSDFYAVGAWLAQQGFAVVIPQRRGYGASEGKIADYAGSCEHPDYVRAGRATAHDIAASIRFMRNQDYVDGDRVVLVGLSTGGWGSIAAASENLPGVVGVVAFGAGHGVNSPGQVCDAPALVAAAGRFGTITTTPVLWIYANNDMHVGPDLSRDLFDAFQATTHGPTEYIRRWNCAAGVDGHLMMQVCPHYWHDTVKAFLGSAAGVRGYSSAAKVTQAPAGQWRSSLWTCSTKQGNPS